MMGIQKSNKQAASTFLNNQWQKFYHNLGGSFDSSPVYFSETQKGKVVGAAVLKLKGNSAHLESLIVLSELREKIRNKNS